MLNQIWELLIRRSRLDQSSSSSASDSSSSGGVIGTTVRFAAGVDTTLYLTNTNGVLTAGPVNDWGGTGYHDGIRGTWVSFYPKHGLKYSLDGGTTWLDWCFEDTNSTLDLSSVGDTITAINKISGRNYVMLSGQRITVDDPESSSAIYIWDTEYNVGGDSSSSGGSSLVIEAELATDTTTTIGTYGNNGAGFTFDTVDNVDAMYCGGGNASEGMTFAPLRQIGGAQPRTFSIWARPIAYASNEANGIYGHGVKDVGDILCLETDTNTNSMHFPWGEDWQGALGNVSMPNIDEWTHIVMTYDGSYVKLYFNGVLQGTSNQVTLHTTNGLVYLGSRVNDRRIWYGYLRKFKVWDVALTAQEISNLYDSELPTFPAPVEYCSECGQEMMEGICYNPDCPNNPNYSEYGTCPECGQPNNSSGECQNIDCQNSPYYQYGFCSECGNANDTDGNCQNPDCPNNPNYGGE